MEKRVCPSYPTWQLGVVTLYNHFVNSYSKQWKRMCKEIKYLWTDRQTDSETQVQHHNTVHHLHKSSITRLLQDLPAGSRPNMWKQYFTSSYITVYYLRLSILTKQIKLLEMSLKLINLTSKGCFPHLQHFSNVESFPLSFLHFVKMILMKIRK